MAVGSRSQGSADAFGDELGIPHRHATYEALVADPDIDAVYVATPHNGHRDAALLALEAGKPVLVEKPFTVSAREAEEVLNAAQARGLFAMEAMWARFLPHMVSVRAELAAGTLGTIRTVVADHGQWFPPDPVHRLFAPELAGGALLDLGIYPLSFVSMVLGTPDRVVARGTKAFTGVDAQTSAVLEYDDGAHGVISTTLESKTPCTAWIAGTEARIEIDGTFYAPSAYTIIYRDGDARPPRVPLRGPRAADAGGRGRPMRASGTHGEPGATARRDPVDHADDGRDQTPDRAGLPRRVLTVSRRSPASRRARARQSA